MSGGFFIGSWVHGHPAATAALKADPSSFRDVVKAVLPAVVSVESKAVMRGNRRRLPVDSDEGPEDLRRFFEQIEPQQNQPRQREQDIGFGSGFLIDGKGVVLTNFHVIEGADQVEVILADGRKFQSKDIKGDARTDLAIVRLDTKGATLPHIELADSNQMEIGDRVLAIGAPFRLSGTVTQGIVSAKGRDLGLNRYDDFLQTDAAINPGNSGGPLVNMEGKVIGINSAIINPNSKISSTAGFQGIGMAISSNMAQTVTQQLIREGVVRRGYLGIELVGQVTPDVAKQYGIEKGVIVAKVRPGGPASKGGLKPDDAITAINGKSIHDIRELQRMVSTIPVNSVVEISILRDRKPMTLKFTLEEEPKDYGVNPRRRGNFNADGESVKSEKSGLTLMDIDSGTAEQLGLPRSGAVISKVERNSPGQVAGLEPGLVIYRINRAEVERATSARDAIDAALKADGQVLLHVQGGNGNGIYLLKTS
ncbi:MAG: trypsin-like peptidase domain-containing protein [Gemmataceae bacterium]